MSETLAMARQYVAIATPRSPEEWERVHTLLRLALAVAQREQAEEGSPEGKERRDAPVE